MTDEKESERDYLSRKLGELLNHMQRYSQKPGCGSRRLSLAITNVEQGHLWLQDHIVNDPLPEGE